MGVFGLLLSLIPGFSTMVALAQFGVGVLYPTLESFKAIESAGSKDDTQWLSYWVVYVVFNLFERFAWIVLRWFPLYNLVKVGVLAWLVLPQFEGAAFVYLTYAKPLLYAIVDFAREVPALEPYVKDFAAVVPHLEKKKKATPAPAPAPEPAPAPAPTTQTDATSFAPLKAHAQ